MSVSCVAVAALTLGLYGCTGGDSADGTTDPPTVATTTEVEESQPGKANPTEVIPSTIASVLGDQVGKAIGDGGEALGEHVVSELGEFDLQYPTDATKVGFVLLCETEKGSWRFSLGPDDSRWISGACSTDDPVTGTLDVLTSDNGQIAVTVEADPGVTAYIMMFARK